MKMQHIFFIVGLIFLFATIIYFSYTYLFSITKEIKTAVLVLLMVGFFYGGEHLRERDI